MPFFDKAMASIGIGSAKVKTYVDNEEIRVGGEFRGMIEISGGSVEQKIDKICLALKTYYMKRVDGKLEKEEFVLQRQDLPDMYTIPADETKMVQFAFPVPLCTPTTFDKDQVWLETQLEIAGAVDSTDREDIQVSAHPFVQKVIDALKINLGLSLHQVINDFGRRPNGALPYVQEYEFRPDETLRDRFDKVKIVFNLDAQGLEIILSIDKHGNFIQELAGNDISYGNCWISIADFGKSIEEIGQLLYNNLMKYAS